MPNRKGLISALWLTSALALLASVLVAPIRTAGFVTVSSRPDCLRRNFALPPGQQTTRLASSTAADAVPLVKALPSEEEEQERADAPDEARVSRFLPASFRKVADRRSAAPRPVLSLYPLRC